MEYAPANWTLDEQLCFRSIRQRCWDLCEFFRLKLHEGRSGVTSVPSEPGHSNLSWTKTKFWRFESLLELIPDQESSLSVSYSSSLQSEKGKKSYWDCQANQPF